MCAKCSEIEKRVAHLKEIAARMLDQMTLDGIASLIRELEARKLALHPE